MAQKMKENLKNKTYVKRAGKPVPFSILLNPTTNYTTKDGDNSNESEDSNSMKCKQLFQKCIHYTSL